jgi:hypothetical protein
MIQNKRLRLNGIITVALAIVVLAAMITEIIVNVAIGQYSHAALFTLVLMLMYWMGDHLEQYHER